jgi:hypothetical protein
MAGLVPAIHVFTAKTWMPATSAGMTQSFAPRAVSHATGH